jgi:acylphosphatase
MSGEQARLEAVVHGYVQGVGFRWRTREVARRLGLRGHVRNRADRTVEVVAEGSRRALEDLLAFLEVGPSASSVRHVDATWGTAGGRYSSFEVRF